MSPFALFISLTFFIVTVWCYYPIFMFHGNPGNRHDFDVPLQVIEKYHPGTVAISLPIDEGDDSYKNLWIQTEDVIKFIRHTVAKNRTLFANGYHFIGHSQGGILSRSVIENFNDHKVRNYISMSGVHNGIYGFCEFRDDPEAQERACIKATKILYTPEFQANNSVANYWRDLDYNNYLIHNTFLPYINNEIESSYKSAYRKNFLRISHGYFFGSRDDEAVIPWYSALFGMFNEDGSSAVPMQEQNFYVNDTFGLRTLDKEGRLTLEEVPGLHHADWIDNEEVFIKYILPLLD